MFKRDWIHILLPLCFMTVSSFAGAATILTNGQTLTIDKTLPSPSDLWVTPADLTRINGFELKPEGACLAEICVPVKQDADNDLFVTRDGQGWVNVTELARKLQQAFAHDAETDTWSFAEIPTLRDAQMQSAIAPDFELQDRKGNTVRLSDFRGKKVLLMTWASW